MHFKLEKTTDKKGVIAALLNWGVAVNRNKPIEEFQSGLLSFQSFLGDYPLDISIGNTGEGFSDDQFRTLVEMFPNIRSLELSGLESVTSIPPGLSNLEKCTIYDCALTDLSNLSDTHLKELNLKCLYRATSLPELPEGCITSIEYCPGLSE